MGSSLLGQGQSCVDLRHREALAPFLARHAVPLSGYTFDALFIWREVFHYRWVFPSPELLLLSFGYEGGPERHLLQPVGVLPDTILSRLAQEAAGLPYPLKIVGVTRPYLDAHPRLADRFDVAEDRAGANYIYRAKDLAELTGRRYSPKRNLISQASREYRWATEPIGPANLEACRTLMRQILGADRRELRRSLKNEVLALDEALDSWSDLSQEGLLLRVEDEPAALSVWERLDARTAVVHFEWALRSRKGLYQVMNRETAQALVQESFEEVNREEDVGDPGLRQAKLSYDPARLVEAYTLTFRR